MNRRVNRWYMLIRAESDYSHELCCEYILRVHYIWKGCARHARSVYRIFACRTVNGDQAYRIACRVCRVARLQYVSASNYACTLCLLVCCGRCYGERPNMVVCFMWKCRYFLQLSLIARLQSSVDRSSEITYMCRSVDCNCMVHGVSQCG